MTHVSPLLFLALLAMPFSLRDEPELTPAPREVERHVVVEKLPAGYRVLLSRKASEKLRDGLAAVGDGKSFTDVAKLIVKELNDPEAETKLEMIAWVVKTQSPALKKALDEKIGPGGAIIRVVGVEKKKLPERPLLKAIGEAFIPDDIKEQIKSGIMVLNMTPLYWKVEERK